MLRTLDVGGLSIGEVLDEDVLAEGSIAVHEEGLVLCELLLDILIALGLKCLDVVRNGARGRV